MVGFFFLIGDITCTNLSKDDIELGRQMVDKLSIYYRNEAILDTRS